MVDKRHLIASPGTISGLLFSQDAIITQNAKLELTMHHLFLFLIKEIAGQGLTATFRMLTLHFDSPLVSYHKFELIGI